MELPRALLLELLLIVFLELLLRRAVRPPGQIRHPIRLLVLLQGDALGNHHVRTGPGRLSASFLVNPGSLQSPCADTHEY